MCVACKPLVLVVHLSKEPFQLRTPLETCLIVGLGVLGGEMGGGGYSQLLCVFTFYGCTALVYAFLLI